MVGAGHQLIGLTGLQQQAPVGFGVLALDDEALLVRRGPAQLRQQRADEPAFKLRLIALGQLQRVKVRRQPVAQVTGAGLLSKFTLLLVNKTLVQEGVDKPRVREQVLRHCVLCGTGVNSSCPALLLIAAEHKRPACSSLPPLATRTSIRKLPATFTAHAAVAGGW